jgi:bifunctional DNA-binding transcriptional regulator/antitoxin component of YhaV-PrlF toxin-antitoxin module
MRGGEIVLGTSKVDPHYRITLVQPIPELLGINAGDLIVFVQDDEGNVFLRVSSIPSAKRSKRREG